MLQQTTPSEVAGRFVLGTVQLAFYGWVTMYATTLATAFFTLFFSVPALGVTLFATDRWLVNSRYRRWVIGGLAVGGTLGLFAGQFVRGFSFDLG